MKSKIKEYKLYSDLYQAEMSYFYGGTADQFISLIKKRHGDAPMYSWGEKFEWGEDANTTDGYQFHFNAVHGDGEKFYLWLLNPTPFLFYHEVYHLSGDVLFTRGVGYSYESEEAHAYFGSWLFNKIFTWMGGRLKAE